MDDRLEFRIAVDEVKEAEAVLARWLGRGNELPANLREQVENLSRRRPEELCEYVEDGEMAVVLTPDMRALVANLRARERAGAL